MQYSVPNYPTSLNPATDGLRNITGRVNGDGTVSIWGITSTVSANGDPGADPNKLVMITDLIAYQTAAGAAFGNEAFTTVRTANPNEVFRGVSLTPTSTTPMSNVPLILSAASPGVTSIAPGGLAFAYGQSLPSVDAGEIIGPFPAAWGGTSVSVTDSQRRNHGGSAVVRIAHANHFKCPPPPPQAAPRSALPDLTARSPRPTSRWRL